MPKKIKTAIIIFLFFAAVAQFLTCSTKIKPEFSSVQQTAEKITELLNKGDGKSIAKIIVQKDEYIKDYYPNFPEAKQKNALSGEDFYGMFVALHRISAIQSKVKKYKGRIVSIVEIGEPEKIIKTDAYVLYRKIPLKLLIEDVTDGKIEITDDKILGAVVEKNGKFRLLSMFR